MSGLEIIWSRRGRLGLIVLGASALLLVLTGTFWVRSYSMGDWLGRYVEPTHFNLRSSMGLISIDFGKFQAFPPPRTGWSGSIWPFTRAHDTFVLDLSDTVRHYRSGFGCDRVIVQLQWLSADSYRVVFPYWFISLCVLIISLLGIKLIAHDVKAARRRAAGLCIHCGYDLRATPDRCPECGRVPEGPSGDIIPREDQESP
jgi:hypothetical protein